jgi:ABC-2 type transport system ATP-binding protein
VTAAVPTVEVTRDPDGTALLSSVGTAQVGEIAAATGLVLHQLATRTASLEEAFFEATGKTEEYVGRLLTGQPNAGGMQ